MNGPNVLWLPAVRAAILLTALLAGLAAADVEATDQAGALTVVVSGFPDDVGLAHLALYASKSVYEDDEATPDRTARLPVRSGVVTWHVDALAPGEYAVRVFHDANGNALLDKSRRGVPKEHFGFSNDPPMKKQRAGWDDAKFLLDAGTTHIEITLLAPPSRSK